MTWIRASLEKASRIRREAGLPGLCSRIVHKLASPIVDWGSVTFFRRSLDPAVLPPLELPAGIRVRRLTAAEIHHLHDGGDPTQDLSALIARAQRGDEAFAAVAESGRPVHLRWVTTSRSFIPELGYEIVLSPRQAYFYNGYTRLDMRGRGFDGFVRHFIFRTLQADGCTDVFSYVRQDNPVGLRAASRWQRPVGTLRYFRVGPFGPFVIGRSRPGMPRLVKAPLHQGAVFASSAGAGTKTR